MAAADTPVERTMFVRKATGLVKGWSVFDAFIYSAFAINLMALGFGYAFTGVAVFPTGGLIAAIILSGLFIIFEVITYASLIAVMPSLPELGGEEPFSLPGLELVEAVQEDREVLPR